MTPADLAAAVAAVPDRIEFKLAVEEFDGNRYEHWVQATVVERDHEHGRLGLLWPDGVVHPMSIGYYLAQKAKGEAREAK